jgi:hypothetical protein
LRIARIRIRASWGGSSGRGKRRSVRISVVLSSSLIDGRN